MYRICYTVNDKKNVPYLFIELPEFSFSVQGLGTGEFTEQLQMNQQTTATKQLQVYEAFIF